MLFNLEFIHETLKQVRFCERLTCCGHRFFRRRVGCGDVLHFRLGLAFTQLKIVSIVARVVPISEATVLILVLNCFFFFDLTTKLTGPALVDVDLGRNLSSDSFTLMFLRVSLAEAQKLERISSVSVSHLRLLSSLCRYCFRNV